MGFDIPPPGLPTGVSATIPFALYCDGTTYQNLMTVQVGPNAPPGPLSIPLRGTTSTGTVCTATATVQIAEVISVVWDEFSVFNTPLDTCPNNGGKRIFPDWLEPDESIGVIQRQVNLRAQISPVIEGCMVQFRSWDVDDPFDQNNSSMSNVSVIDANTSGPDNRPVGGPDSGVSQWSDAADSSGVAQKTLVISMQPGNNYRAGASTRAGKLAAVTQAQADSGIPPQGVRFSQMLTVWRKLNVEVDSMDSEPLTTAGRSPDWDDFDAIFLTHGASTTMFTGRGLTTPLGQLAGLGPDHYEGGVLVYSLPTRIFPVLHDLANFDTQLQMYRVTITADGTVSPQDELTYLSSIAIIRDDDQFAQQLPLPYQVAGDAFIQSAYGRAYIQIQQQDSLNPRPLVPFDTNLSDIELMSGDGYDDFQDTLSQNAFWTSLVIMAYQPAELADADPDPWIGMNNTGGADNPAYDPAFGFGTTINDSDNASVIFIEVHRDIGSRTENDLSHTIAHEIGHASSFTGNEDDDHNEGGLMSPGAPSSQCCFSAQSLTRFRSVTKW